MTNPSSLDVLWLQPSTGDHVSVRRERIADHLEDMGLKITIRNASGIDAIGAVIEAVTGGYDVIIGNVRIGLYLGYVLSVILQKPFIGDVSDPLDDIDHLSKPLYTALESVEWCILEKAEASFFVERESCERAEKLGINPILAPNSVDFGKFRNPPQEVDREAKTILERHGVSLEKPIVVYIGSMVQHYHLPEAGRAANLTPEWEFIFIGKERGVGIDDIVSGVENAYFLGAYDYDLIPGFLSHSDAALCLTDKEQPLKILEYGAAGLPTLGYSGKLREKFTDDEVLFVDADPVEISNALRDIASDSGKASRYGKNLQRKAEENSWRAVAEMYYERIVEVSET